MGTAAGEVSASRARAWKSSRYNLVVPVEDDGGAIFNGVSGACLDVREADFRLLSTFLKQSGPLDFALLGDRAVELGGRLIAGGFIVDSATDELAALKECGRASKQEGVLTLTISPTFACNLECGYCFVGKKQGYMSKETEQQIIDFVAGYLDQQSVPAVSVDWFGGEPLLASSSIERLSHGLMEICSAKGIPYSAQIITNGTMLTPTLVARLEGCGIDRLQISVDGMEDLHNERRPWKAGKRASLPVVGQSSAQRSSFQDTIAGIEAALGRFAIRLRVNVDRHNLDDAMTLLLNFQERGWLNAKNRFYPYLSLVRDYTEAARVNWQVEDEPTSEAFHRLYERWLDVLNANGIPVVKQSLYGFPEPKPQPCTAVTSRGWIINEDGTLHKCGLDLDTDELSVGKLGEALDLENKNMKYWTGYDHFSDPVCQNCHALPVCQGGCARDRREKRDHLVSSNCEYHLKYEPRILAQHVRLNRLNRSSRPSQTTSPASS